MSHTGKTDELELFRAELAAKAAEAIGAVLPHTPDIDGLSRQVVDAITEGWSARRDFRYFRDAAGMVLNAANLVGGFVGPESACVDVVAWHVSLPVRELNAEERKVVNERDALREWLQGDGKTPPPPQIRFEDLLEQDRWWVTRDKQVMRLKDMAPSHRANTLKMLERNALAWYDTILMNSMIGAPDDVETMINAELHGSEAARRKAAAKWLRSQPLVKRLRKLGKAVRILAADAAVDTAGASSSPPVSRPPSGRHSSCN